LYFDRRASHFAQLFGSIPKSWPMRRVTARIWASNHVDINFGCRLRKWSEQRRLGLLRDLPLVEKLLRSVKSAISIPLTMNSAPAGTIRNWSMCKCQAGRGLRLSAIALHPRTREQGYSGHAD